MKLRDCEIFNERNSIENGLTSFSAAVFKVFSFNNYRTFRGMSNLLSQRIEENIIDNGFINIGAFDM